MEKIIYLVSFYVVAKQKLHQAILNSQKGLYSCERGRRERSSEFSLNSSPLKQRQESLWRLSAKFLDTSVLVTGFTQSKNQLSPIFLMGGTFITWKEASTQLRLLLTRRGKELQALSALIIKFRMNDSQVLEKDIPGM